ncbi:DUF3224 domain-containing protein [Saccharothrix syringae]|uniref:DUF3224 family protein n=1 Tax=Saccharothrix syringae TaxID=103733 RepID=A0A5Q0GRP2_SACSY|nr:DUF3224 domain-containing protein [Saccharothrix syringae]QFZ16756.1 DUF3224 family protein [Saccharothrix syringae]
MESKFTITRWGETTRDAAAPALARVLVEKTCTGLMAGTGVAEPTTCQPSEGQAGYVGTERFTGTPEGRTGSFVVRHGGVVPADGARSFGHVVPGSGTGEPAGIGGEVRLAHELITLDVAFGGTGLG